MNPLQSRVALAQHLLGSIAALKSHDRAQTVQQPIYCQPNTPPLALGARPPRQDSKRWERDYSPKPSAIQPPTPNNLLKPLPLPILLNISVAEEWGMRTDWVTAFRDGVDPGFSQLPDFEAIGFDHNYTIDPMLLPSTIKNIRSLIARRILEPVDKRPLLVSPMFAVPKPTLPGLPIVARPVFDCKASMLNAAMFDQDMALPTLRDAIRTLRKDYFLSKYDQKDGFYHLGIGEKWVDLFGVVLPDQLEGLDARCHVPPDV